MWKTLFFTWDAYKWRLQCCDSDSEYDTCRDQNKPLLGALCFWQFKKWCVESFWMFVYKWRNNRQRCCNLQNMHSLCEASLDQRQPEGANLVELLRSTQGRHTDMSHAAQLCAPPACFCLTQNKWRRASQWHEPRRVWKRLHLSCQTFRKLQSGIANWEICPALLHLTVVLSKNKHLVLPA